MFNFKLSPLWLFGIVIIVLIVSMLWYNNASIEGFGGSPPNGSDLLKYYPDASNSVIQFGLNDNKNYFDTNTGNIIIDYDQTMTIIDRAGNLRKFIKDDLETSIQVKNDEVHKGSTYGAFSLYEDGDSEQLFYISVGTKTFIHSMNLDSNEHGPTCVIDAGRGVKNEFILSDLTGVSPQSTLPSVTLNSVSIDISGITVDAMEFVNGIIYYDPSAQLLIKKTVNTVTDDTDAATSAADAATSAADAATAATTADAGGLQSALTAAAAALTDAATALTNMGDAAAAAAATAASGVATAATTADAGGLQSALTAAAAALTDAATALTPATTGFTLFNNRFTKEELEGFTTVVDSEGSTITWDIYDREGIKKLSEFAEANYTASTDPSSLVVKNLTNEENTLQVLMMSHEQHTVIIVLTNEGTSENHKYTLLGTRRYIGTNIEQPTTAPSTPNYTPEEGEGEGEGEGEDITDSAMSEYWKWFHYWNADGGSMGGSQPMSQDYMLKTDYVPMTCPGCAGKGSCPHVNGGGGGGEGGGGGGGIVGTTGGVANNLINKTSGLAEKTIDTATGLAIGGALAGGAAAVGAVGLGKEATQGAVGLGKEATQGAVGLGKEATQGAVGLGREVASGAKSVTQGAIGLGREVVTGTVGLGKDVVGGTADFIKDTQRNGQYANAGGYASGSNGDIQTRKYVKGQGVQAGGMDPYTYNGLLSKRGGSNYMPLTSDFSSFR
jgi:hypothetical protein